MKRVVMMVATLFITVGGWFALSPPTNAVSTFQSNEADNGSVVLAKGVVHDGAYFAAAQTVVVEGTINGDLYCAGQNVTVNGTVNGDVICGGQKITVNGAVSQDVRVAGQIVMVNGKVGGTVSAMGQDVTVSRGAEIAKDLNGFGQNFTVDGTVGKDLAVAGQMVQVSGTVRGGAHVATETLTLAGQPAIAGDLAYWSKNEQQPAAGTVGGKVAFTNETNNEQLGSNTAGAIVGFVFLLGTMVVVTTLALALLMPRYFERSYQVMRTKLGMTALVGLVFQLAAPVVALLLALTGVGMPLAILLILVDVIIKMVAFPFAAYYLARTIFYPAINNVLLLALVGAILLFIVCMVPILNVIVLIAVAVFGTGALILTILNGYRKPNYTVPTPPVATKK